MGVILTKEKKLTQIAEIDAAFEKATGWGSWMVDYANERARLVHSLKEFDGMTVPHKYRTNAS